MKFIHSGLLLLFLSSAFAQKPTDAMLVGDIQTKADGEHIPFATVQIKGTTIGTVTDYTGHYMLNNLPIGTFTLVARATGLKTQEQTVTFEQNETVELKFLMEPDPINLDNVVVTASRTVQTRSESPVVVNSIQPQLFQATQSINLAEGINFMPGLRTENNCENCGFNQARINGLEGNYTQVLINSRPVFSGLASVYGLEILPANMIERVETVRGGGSVLYSGNAVAGVVNLITKEPTSNSFEADINYRLHGVGMDDPQPDFNASFNTTIVSDDSKSGLALFGYYRDRTPFDANGDGFSEITSIENNTIGIKTFHRPSSYNKITLDYLRLNEFRRGGNKFDYLPHEADIAEQVEHNINNLSLTMDQYFRGKPNDLLSVYASGQTVGRDSYYGAEKDPAAYGYSEDLSSIVGAKYVKGFDKSELLVGVENISNNLIDKKLGVSGEDNRTITDQKINTLGAFVQNEFKFASTKLMVGVRADNYSIANAINPEADNNDLFFIPRINLMQNFTPDLQLRLSYSQGYRAPQVFDEDLHIESSGLRRIFHQNADGLIRETSHSYTGSLGYNASVDLVYFEALIEGFYTDLQDAFIYEFGEPDANNDAVYTRYNSEDGAVVAGVNFELNMAIGTQVRWQSGFTVQTAKYGEAEPEFGKRAFYRTPETYGFFVLDWKASPNLNLSLNNKYTGHMLVPHFTEDDAFLVASPIFMDTGVKLDYDIKISPATTIEVYTGVNNIFNSYQDDFDTGVYRDPAFVYGPGLPRTFFIGLKFIGK
jgi:outer membrane receptor for ferrienterochelin and colicins